MGCIGKRIRFVSKYTIIAKAPSSKKTRSATHAGLAMVDYALTAAVFSERMDKISSRKKTPLYLDEISPAAHGFAAAMVLRKAAGLK